MIEVIDLHKSFAENHVLRGVNLSVEEGTTVVILGSSGSGKSVLMKHIIGLLHPDSGRVLVDGEEISKLSGRDLNRVRRKFGMVFQFSALFDSMTVFENVAFPLREHQHELSESQIREVVDEKLRLVDLDGVDRKMPAELSGGMRKRVALARAIARDPKIVLYDEPTTGLDPITTESVNEMIENARDRLGVTSLVISHDIPSAFRVADRIAVLHHGKIVEFLPPDELRESEHPHVRTFLQTWFGRA
ncbi:ABC transporter ATP-binding protein [Vulgatibacter incomptus]|nr:ABC transporter ATP-binding protein [Vulgatibacter incomptus]